MSELMEYLERLPAAVPADRALVHNHVLPSRVIGRRGFRAWLEPPDPERLVVCGCGWAPGLSQHFRVRVRGTGQPPSAKDQAWIRDNDGMAYNADADAEPDWE